MTNTEARMTDAEAALFARAVKAAYATGQRAYYSGKPNPYAAGTPESDSWASGYDNELAEYMSETARLDNAGY